VTLKIRGTETMTPDALRFEIEHGGRFVVYGYCISILVLSFKRVSGIYYIRPDESAFGKGIIFSLISLTCGWWGIPWGPIWTIATVVRNCRGGLDVTEQVAKALTARAA